MGVSIGAAMDYCLPLGYKARLEPEYFRDEDYEGVWQPDVYPDAAAIAERLGARRIIDVGCGTGEKLVALHPDFEIIGIDYGPNIEDCRTRYDFGTWLDVDLDHDDSLGISEFTDSVLVCADVIEHLVHPERLLKFLSDALDRGAGAVVLSTPDRDRINEPGHLGPPPNLAHVREWSSSELERFMAASGLAGHFGRTRTNDVIPALRTILAVIPGRSPQQREIVGQWFDERRKWQRVPEEQDRSFSGYEAWTRDLEAHRDWLEQQREAWETRARDAEKRIRELEVMLGPLGAARQVRWHLKRAVRRARARRG